ncbi:MAG: glycosyltransferase [Holosporaceae bacterium]|jgi:glycosyltransferase involved in cell wall biosynthesis|nr:glycosyltransferase [Holosporaceae bacterium]
MIPKMSIIIAVYNVEEFLKQCLTSVLNQSLKEIEIICVNDGSQDNSLDILNEFAATDNRLIVINQENKGQGAARNSAMKVARGEYIGFVDSDDWIDLDYFQKLYETAQKYNADIACCGIVREYSSKSRIKLNIKEEKLYCSAIERYRIAEIPQKSYIYNKIYKRSELENNEIFFPEGVYFEDIYFSTRALYFLQTLVSVPKIVYHYRVNYQSTTRNMSDKKQRDQLAARKDFIHFSRKYHINCDERCYIKRKILYKCFGIPLIKIYEWKTIRRYYLFAIIPILEKRISL